MTQHVNPIRPDTHAHPHEPNVDGGDRDEAADPQADVQVRTTDGPLLEVPGLEPAGFAMPEDWPVASVRSDGRRSSIFRKMLQRGPDHRRVVDGDVVRVVDRDQVHLGYGLWNGASQLPVRLFSNAPEDRPPGETFWTDRLDRASALRTESLSLDALTNAYRVIHAEGDGLPGLIVDRYDDVLSAEVFHIGILRRIGPILGHLAARLGTRHAIVAMDEAIAIAEGLGRPFTTQATPGLPPRITVHEYDVRFRIRFADAHKTGFFCDQRENRRALAELAVGRTVLDLCCYTGGFGVAALARGAGEVTCVDLDENALALAKQNADANQVRPKLVHADSFGYMRQMLQNTRRFDVVVLDPPKLITTPVEIASGKRKYFDMNRLALQLVEPGGLLLTCSCSGLLAANDLVGILRAAAHQVGRPAQILRVTGAGPDHPVALNAPEGTYLKAVWLRVGGERDF